jgi:hypothetical protein
LIPVPFKLLRAADDECDFSMAFELGNPLNPSNFYLK